MEDEQLKSSFNGWIKNVAFIAFNEVAHDNRGRNSLNSKIKSIITDPSITINEKNIRTYQLDNNINCIFYSNERVPLLVERSDRRFTILETGGNLANIEWFEAQASFKKFKKELPQFAQYLWNIDVDMKKANNPLENDMKKVLISAAQNRWEEFSHHLKTGDKEWFEEFTQDISGLYEFDSDNKVPQYKSLNFEEIAKNGRIAKDQALRIFVEMYRDRNVTKNVLSKHISLYGIYGKRLGSGDDRLHFYQWDAVKQKKDQGKP